MSNNRNDRQQNDTNQSGENRRGFGQDERDLGAGGQRDQNIGGQQHQQHDVNRDRKLGNAGLDAKTPRQDPKSH